MRIESKTTGSAKDQQLGPLAPLVRAAEPLEELTAQERLRIKHRLRSTLLPGQRSTSGFRWATAFAALGLLLAGGVVFAAAGHFGLIPWPREARPRVGNEQEDGHARRRPVRAVRPMSAPASVPAGAVDRTSAAAPEEMPAVAPSPAAEPTLSPPSSAPVASPEPGRLVAALAPASASPRAGRVSHATQARTAASALGAATNGQARAALQSQPKVMPGIASPPAAEAAPSPPSLAPVAASEAGTRLAMAAPVSQRPARVSHSPAVAPPAATSVAPSPNAQAMLGKALRSLRNDRDPAGALDILTRHEALFPQSPLASERSVLEVEALLALGRNDEALLRLDRISLDNTPRSAERYVVRGELRARAKRWQEAGADFDRALAHGRGTSPWQERALWGRAVTRTRAGDHAGARADLQLYLQIYPAGRFASEAARLLAAAR